MFILLRKENSITPAIIVLLNCAWILHNREKSVNLLDLDQVPGALPLGRYLRRNGRGNLHLKRRLKEPRQETTQTE